MIRQMSGAAGKDTWQRLMVKGKSQVIDKAYTKATGCNMCMLYNVASGQGE